MRIIQAVVQFAASQCLDKCCVIFERTSHGAPDHLPFRVILRECRNQNMISMSDSAALVMDNVVLSADRCPNQALACESRVGDDTSRVPLLAWFRQSAVTAAVTKGEDCGRQSAGDMNLVEARGILQHAAILRRKLRDICVAQALKRDGKRDIKGDTFYARPNAGIDRRAADTRNLTCKSTMTGTLSARPVQ
jgi:hypothetical protein